MNSENFHIAILQGIKAAKNKVMDESDCPYGYVNLMERCAWLAAFRDHRNEMRG